MWAFVMRWFRLGLDARPVPVRVRSVEHNDWNGTIMSGETYR